MTDEKLTLGMMLKIARVKRHLSQKDAADLLGINRTQFGKYERDDNYPVTHKLLILAEFIGVSVDTLLRLNPERNYHGGTISKAIFIASAGTVARVMDWITRYSLGGLRALEGKRPALSMSELEETFFNARHSRYKKAQLDSRFKVYLDEKSGVDVFKKDYSEISWFDLVNTIKGMKQSTAYSKEWGIFKSYHELFMIEGRIGESPSQIVARRFNVSSSIVKGIALRFPDNAGRAYEQRIYIDNC